MSLVLCALASAGYRGWKKPDEDWYQFRALAESVKTLTWRYSMRAAPFNADEAISRAEFRNHLKELLRVNSSLGPKFETYSAEADQITKDMSDARSYGLDSRKELYWKSRIQDQRTWYAKKASANKTSSRNWQFALASTYLLLFLFLGLRVAFPDFELLAPEPLLVGASAIVGWMQVKKFNDLAAAYLLTAQEIGIASTEVSDITEEKEWSKFVIECEQVFSREHTQWIARRAGA